MSRLFFSVWLIWFSWALQAQSGGTDRFSNPGGGGGGNQRDIELDTFDFFYYYAENPNQEIPFSDTILGNNFRFHDPVRKRDLDYRHLGNLGSAHEPIFWDVPERRGFDIGLHQYDLYQIRGNQLKYYRLERPFSEVSYTIGAEQADGYTTAALSRNFANGLNFSLDYKRINQLSESAQYRNQNSRNTALATGLAFRSLKGSYRSFFSFSANTIEQENNGGLLTEATDGGEFNSLSSADVFLETAQSRHAHRELLYTQYFNFGGKPDSLVGFRRAFTIAHQIGWLTSLYKYWDEYDAAQDSSFYNQFPIFLPDQRGSRFYLQHRKLENSFRLATFKLDKNRQSGARNQRDLLELGLVHSLHLLDYEPGDTSLNNLFLTGRYRFNPNPNLRINLAGHFGILDNAGDYLISGDLFFNLKSVGSLTLQARNQLYSPNLIQYQLQLSEASIWQNEWNKTLTTSLSATYELPSFQLSLSGQYHLVNSYIYFDADGMPRQTGVPVSIIQLVAKKNFKFWKFRLDNIVGIQQASEEVIRLPGIYAKHSLYYSGKWFKVLDVELGFDLRYNNAYFANYYNPVSGQFQLQNDRKVEFYPATDAFFSMKITKFRAFVRLENASAIIREDLFYQTTYYAHPNSAMRIGLVWRFLN